MAETAFCRDREQLEVPVANTKTFFESMRDFWYPPSPKVAEHSTAHAEEYSNIMEPLRSKDELRRLDTWVFPQIARAGRLEDRDEFYVCNELIQLMENVYADLDLEQYYQHPHVRGWMTVFQGWARQKAFQRTWEITKSTYASRFQRFYEERLEKDSAMIGRRMTGP